MSQTETDRHEPPKPLVMSDTEILDFLSSRNITAERAASGEWFVYWHKPKRGHIMGHTLRNTVCRAAAYLKQDEDQDNGRFDLEEAVCKAEFDEDR